MKQQVENIANMVVDAIHNTPKKLTFRDDIKDILFANEDMAELRVADTYYTFRFYVHVNGTRRVHMDWNIDENPDGINIDAIEEDVRVFLERIQQTSYTEEIVQIKAELEAINTRRDQLNKKVEEWKRQNQ
jgi:hypothetical protein